MRVVFIEFVSAGKSSFVLRDYEILRKHFDVRELQFTSFKKPSAYWRLFKGVMWSNVVYSWWAASWGTLFAVLFAKILRKKSTVVVGGYEVAYEPEMNYGSLLSIFGRLKLKLILKHASKIFTVSKSSTKEMIRFMAPKNFSLIYNGIDTENFKPKSHKKDLVITVGSISKFRIKKKRFDVFVKASKYLPEVSFLLIGKFEDASVEDLRKMGGSNVEFTGYVSNYELLRYYQQAKVYCQLSTQESFGVALAEAMSCSCVPVVVKRYSLPEIVGDSGFYTSYGNPKHTAEMIKKALKSNKGRQARDRIERNFSLEKREKLLVEEISQLV